MPPLDASLRNTLESRIIEARDAAEEAAEKALMRLAVHEASAYSSLSDTDKALRRKLRAKGRQLNDPLERDKDDPLPGLIRECAYEGWHSMLFAKFLAENSLLMYDGEVAVTLDECAELAEEAGVGDRWTVAASCAADMLPGIFKVDDPLLQIRFAPEDRRRLETLIEGIPKPTYTADDGLGWVYQFWQTKRKKEVNDSGRKIGGADISPVTQLFTEHYMVQFLLHNTLGAWWTSRHPDAPLPTDKSYLRTLDDGTPAAGSYSGWPEHAKDLKLMDPCCGSGHFLIAAFDLMRRFRMTEEGLNEREAGDAVIRDNLHGLEIDPRCTQIAAFNVALEAWKGGGYRTLPPMNIACSGISVGGREEEWTELAGGEPRLARALSRLYHLFKNAPDLGSLIDPTKLGDDDQLFTARFEEVEGLLDKALGSEKTQDDPVAAVFGDTAKGVTRAAKLLKDKYHVVITNVPYLARGKQDDTLRSYIERVYPLGKADLATAFVERSRSFCQRGGSYALVTPQNWLFLGSYRGLRELFLKTQGWNMVGRLGTGAFETISGEVVNVVLLAITNSHPSRDHHMAGISVSEMKTPIEKEKGLLEEEVKVLEQTKQSANPDSRLSLEELGSAKLLEDYSTSLQGIATGDYPRFGRYFWELFSLSEDWEFQQSTVDTTLLYAGKQNIVFWESNSGAIARSPRARVQGQAAFGGGGVAVSQMNNLPCTLHTPALFDNNTAVVLPQKREHLPAIWAFCSSPDFAKEVRKIDKKVSVTNATLAKVPFDLEHWQKVADEQYPDGLPEPYSNDPTQWLFNGNIAQSTEPLQVAVARLLGYNWPEQGKSTAKHPFPDPETDLDDLLSSDGIVPLSAVAGEAPAAERLRALLARAYGSRYTMALQDTLLASVGFDGKSLGAWLEGGFFKQHCKLFGNRPSIWHIWDGHKDGFSALVNYHKLDYAGLQKLIYTYLGAYIQTQTEAAAHEETGADTRLAKAQELKEKLEAILEGEAPYDIFVRWKPLSEQPIGWNPDLNDGVRLNIRPFVKAGVLRSKFTVHWKKDRGTDPTPNASGTTERLNDLHLTLKEKQKARKASGTA